MTGLAVAAIQMRSGMDAAANIDTLRDLVAEAAGRGARYVQTPEMTGCLVRDRASLMAGLRTADDDPVVAAAAELAAAHEIYLHIGSTAVRIGDAAGASASGPVAANRAFVFGPDGRCQAVYDKIHMFDVDLDNGESWRESATYRAGEEMVTTRIDDTVFGLAICYDIRFPQLFRDQALAGASVLTAPAAFTRQTGVAHWHVLQRSRAIENGAFVISAAQGGDHEDGRETYGHSLIVDPWGRVLAEADGDEAGVVLAQIDPAESAAARRKIPNLKNSRTYRCAAPETEKTGGTMPAGTGS
ncbi:carbon-nitrogen hydrolase family protein [Pseudohoeflea coraliihabitans]|uniref:Carbon-nitrogen hydrolase family protein n=1 Tax=Pseudohoeflea coraliihabitans TaxID=2860393 RepID=A0ABS6WKJ3_9HYPH|nr:carbon-nitrogen hydrolase family protein [Pseudohoeflea sp. DP4N28-3]MBW3096472.1 carbon-nitrogen hydrolase family protein [Pseudohoeflea sp. DP4N28-3]